jgi:hypothetical protein
VETEDGFIEWCQTRFLEIVEKRDYARGTRTKEEKDREGGDGREGLDDESEGERKKLQGIGLGAALKYLAQGMEPTKPPLRIR